MGLVIGLNGAKGAGKDQFFRAIKIAFPHMDIRKIAYADPIKHEVMRIFSLESEDEYDQFKRSHMQMALKREPGDVIWVNGRQTVREIGMLMRKYDEQQFVRYVEDTINANPAAIWCITDLRFQNELESIKNNLNGIVIKIKRDGFAYDGHITEVEFPDEVCSSVITNGGTLVSMNIK